MAWPSLDQVVRFAVWIVIGLCLHGCSPDRVEDRAGKPGSVFVTSNGWHSGIVVARRDLLDAEIPEIADFPQARYLEFGWGDAKFYPAERTDLIMTLRAGLIPTPAVMHVVPRSRAPNSTNADIEVLALAVPDMGRLTTFLAASFDREDTAGTIPGLYPKSRFYPATGRFHLANTCNSWTARGLRAAGLEIDEAAAARAEDLMAQLRPLSVPIPRR